MERAVYASPFCLYIVLIVCILSSEVPLYGAQSNSSSFVPSDAILMNCGSAEDAEDADGRRWVGDVGSKFAPASANSLTATAADQDPALPSQIPYMTARVFTDEYTYSFAVSGGRHWVRLHFYPSSYNGRDPNNGVFSVRSGAYVLLHNFSVATTCQALTQAYLVREFSINATSGQLNLTFAPGKGKNYYAFVNGIEVASMPDLFKSATLIGANQVQVPIDLSSALQTMVRLNIGGQFISPVRDSNLSRTWYDDSPYIYGAAFGITISADPQSSILYSDSVPEYIAPPDVYSTARSMTLDPKINMNFNLTWKLFVDSNFTYLVRLHFCELVYTKPSQRVFDIFINNQTAETNFDVIALTQSKNSPIYEDYVVYMPPQSGDTFLWVALHPDASQSPEYYDAILNGMEIFKLNDSSGNLAGPNPVPAPAVDVSVPVFRGNASKSTSKGPVIGAATGGIAALSLVFAFCYYLCQRRGKVSGPDRPPGWIPLSLYGGNSQTMSSKVSTTSEKSGTGSYVSSATSNLGRHFTLAEIQEATNNFDESLLLGVGGFGKVYRGEVDGGIKVAVKRGNPTSEQGVNEFQTEIEMLSKLRHRHLVSLIGYCEENSEMILVYDYMARGTLRSHLYKSNTPPLSWKQRLEICIGAARGLHYLHTGAKYTIIHRDVKTTNILLDEKLVAKVSDFGLSKTGPSLDHTHVSTVVKGSFGYLDPEYFRRQQLTEKSDVYSFGIVLFEVLCARPALNASLPREQVSLAEWALHCQRKGILDHIMDPHLKGRVSPESLRKFGETAQKCVAEQGIHRPSMGDVLWNLEFALQLHESAIENKTVDDSMTDLIETPLKPNHANNSANNVMDSHSTGISIGDQSLVSEGSDDITPGAVFSQLVNPKGR